MKFEDYQKTRREKGKHIEKETTVQLEQGKDENDYEYNNMFTVPIPYQILVTATMSAGKSTLINAIVGKNVCKSQNLACTSQLHYIINKPIDIALTSKYGSAPITIIKNGYDQNEMDISFVNYEGILAEQRIVICDSPGVNYSGEIKHKQITDQMISTEKYQMIVYLMNATQLGTTDDEAHLEMVKKHVGKKIVLFVMNKIDLFNEEDGDIESIILKQIKYLESRGFHNPLVCPVSAKAGLLAKKVQKEELSKQERRELNCLEDKLEKMKVAEYYIKYFPNVQISDNANDNQQLLKTCGLSYIEEIINAFCEIGGVAAQVHVKYNPYRLATLIEINGQKIGMNSKLYKIQNGKRLQEWIGGLPEMLVNKLNTMNFEIEFCGMDLDWDDFEDAFQYAKSVGIIKNVKLKYTRSRTAKDVTDRIVGIFNELLEGPIDDIRAPKLLRAFENVCKPEFAVNVIATMSAGKTTLINALLGRKLIPSNNASGIAVITEVLDNDSDHFTATVYDKGHVIRKINKLTYDVMSELTENEQVSRISVEGDIPFVDARERALILVDTPGPNNSQNQEHKNTTYNFINNDSNSLILYVLNSTQLGTNDDNFLLNYVADQLKKGGKHVRDRFLFVINKMDVFNPEEEDVGKILVSAKRYLCCHGIEEPQIFPCSAAVALNIRSCLNDVDIDNLTRDQVKQLSPVIRNTLPMIYNFIEYESMYLEKYATISFSDQRKLDFKLKQAQEQNNKKEMALIHSGVYSIEAAIKAYVKRYAETKKIKDLVETLYEVLESNNVLIKLKQQIAIDEGAIDDFNERKVTIGKQIVNVKEVLGIKQKVEMLDPVKKIKNKAEMNMEKIIRKAVKILAPYGDMIYSKNELRQLVTLIAKMSLESIAELTVELESVINQELIEYYRQTLWEYQEKLREIVIEPKFDYYRAGIINEEFAKMTGNIEEWFSDNFVSEFAEIADEEFPMEKTVIQSRLIVLLRTTIEESIKRICSNAEIYVENIKEYCVEMIKILDGVLTKKYNELKQCEIDQMHMEEEREKSKDLLNWIEFRIKTLDKILDI